MQGVQVMATISLQCNNLSHKFYFLQAENSMTGREYMEEVLIQEMNELLENKVNA